MATGKTQVQKNVEIIIYAFIIALAGHFMVNAQPLSYFYFTLIHWNCVAFAILITRFAIGPALQQKKYSKAGNMAMLTFAFLYSMAAYFFCKYLQDISGQHTMFIAHPVIFKKVSPAIFIGYGIGAIHLINWKNKYARRLLQGIALVIVLAGIIGLITYWLQL